MWFRRLALGALSAIVALGMASNSLGQSARTPRPDYALVELDLPAAPLLPRAQTAGVTVHFLGDPAPEGQRLGQVTGNADVRSTASTARMPAVLDCQQALFQAVEAISRAAAARGANAVILINSGYEGSEQPKPGHYLCRNGQVFDRSEPNARSNEIGVHLTGEAARLP